MLFDRLEAMWNRWGIPGRDYTQTEFAALVGIPESTMSKLKSGRIQLVDSERMDLLARTLFKSPAWLQELSEEQWSDDLLTARIALRTWAKEADLAATTPGRRLAAAWNQLHELLPSLREEVFGTYCRCVYMKRTVPGKMEFAAVTDAWDDIKAGRAQPLPAQLKGAAWFTGLPLVWFETGEFPDDEISEADMERLALFLRQRRVTVDEAIHLLTELHS